MTHELLIDAYVAGRFRVVHHIGAGGMGDVYKAFDERDGRPVALKVLSARAQNSAVATERLLREGAAGARIRHQGVVRVVDVGLADGRAYLAMELLEGEDLGKRLERDGPMDIAQVRELARQLCDALTALHAAGIVHRDLKPRNLFLAREASGSERLTVLDFGLAKAAFLGDSLTEAEQVFGTLLYLSPEQLRGARYADVRSDIWAAGTIVYEALTGRAAFSGDSAPEVVQKITCGAPQRVEELRPDIPRALALWVWRAMQNDPALRFQSARAMRVALDDDAPHGAQLPRPDALTRSLTHVLTLARATQARPATRRWSLSVSTLALACGVVLLLAATSTNGGASAVPEPRIVRDRGESGGSPAARSAVALQWLARADAQLAASTASTATALSDPKSPVVPRARVARKARLTVRPRAEVPAPPVRGSAGEIKRSEF